MRRPFALRPVLVLFVPAVLLGAWAAGLAVTVPEDGNVLPALLNEYAPGTLVQIGGTAFGGFAQLTLPVALALYWHGTTKWGTIAGVVGSQVFYLASVFLGFVPATIFAWDASLYGMALGALLTVGVSLRTHAAPEEDVGVVFEGLGAD